MGQKAHAGQNAHAFYQYLYGLWSQVLLKQSCQRIGLLINRHFEEARLLVAFYHEFKHFVHFSVNRAD